MIKRILLIGGGLVLLVLFAVAAANYYSSYQASQYNDTVVPYLEKVIPKISTWDVDVIRAHMAAEQIEQCLDKAEAAARLSRDDERRTKALRLIGECHRRRDDLVAAAMAYAGEIP